MMKESKVENITQSGKRTISTVWLKIIGIEEDIKSFQMKIIEGEI